MTSPLGKQGTDDKLHLQIRTYHPLAICYNDQSPLENHHLAAAVRITLSPEYRHLFVSGTHVSGNSLTNWYYLVALFEGLQWQCCCPVATHSSFTTTSAALMRDAGGTLKHLRVWYLAICDNSDVVNY